LILLSCHYYHYYFYPQLYRDCLRLVRYIAPGESSKALALRQTVRQQFKLNAKEKDASKIEALKSDAVRALSNFMLYQSAQKDRHLQKAMNINTNANTSTTANEFDDNNTDKKNKDDERNKRD